MVLSINIFMIFISHDDTKVLYKVLRYFRNRAILLAQRKFIEKVTIPGSPKNESGPNDNYERIHSSKMFKSVTNTENPA